MSVCAQAREIPGGAAVLETTARELFSQHYRALTDEEAGQVWDKILGNQQERSAVMTPAINSVS